MHNECGKVLVFQVENAGKCRKIGFRKRICNVENAVEKWKTGEMRMRVGAKGVHPVGRWLAPAVLHV